MVVEQGENEGALFYQSMDLLSIADRQLSEFFDDLQRLTGRLPLVFEQKNDRKVQGNEENDPQPPPCSPRTVLRPDHQPVTFAFSSPALTGITNAVAEILDLRSASPPRRCPPSDMEKQIRSDAQADSPSTRTSTLPPGRTRARDSWACPEVIVRSNDSRHCV